MDYKDINDYELLYMVSENNDDALDVLFKKYRPIIDRKIRHWYFLAKRCGMEKEDLEQEIFLIFIKAYKNYSDNSSLFYTYFNFLVDNHLKSYFKGKKIVDEKFVSLYEEDDDNVSLLEKINDLSKNPDDLCNYSIIMEKCNDFSYLLNQEHSLMFELYFHGYKINEIAELFDKNSNTVSVTVNRILKNLKKYLVKEGCLVL